MPGHVFISHTTDDDNAVAETRTLLESLGLSVWVDSRNLRGGDKLAPEIETAIEDAGYVLAVLSLQTVNSSWVPREIDHALAVEKARGDGYRVIPVLLPGTKPSALGRWFPEERLAVSVPEGPTGIQDALPAPASALGLTLREDVQKALQPKAAPVADLVLELEDPGIDTADGQHRATATAKLVFRPPDGREVESDRFRFKAPLGPIETGEIAWYLERYCHWPSGVFQERARQVEAKLEEWGHLLAAPLLDETTRNAFEAWDRTPPGVTRRFSVLVDDRPVKGSSEEERNAAREGATLLLSLPWELVHDRDGFLFQGARPCRCGGGCRTARWWRRSSPRRRSACCSSAPVPRTTAPLTSTTG